MIDTGSATALVAISTMCTIVYIGLGFLPRPRPAAAVWTLAFTVFAAAGYTWLAAESMSSVVWRAAASGLMLGTPALLWLGLRVDRGECRHAWWLAIAWLVAAPLWLAATAMSPDFVTSVRLSFSVGGVFAALTVAELLRLGAHRRDQSLPLVLVSVGYVLLAALTLFHEVVRIVDGADPSTALYATRSLNLLGSQLFVVCAAFTLLLLTREQSPDEDASASPTFATTARGRLARAEESGDRWWSILIIRLDDPDVLRLASSTNAFDHLAHRFQSAVRRSLPAEADIESRGDSAVIVLLPRPEGAVRQVLAKVLGDIAAIGDESPIGVRPSASVGWAQVDVVGYRLDDLIREADAAAERARSRGGDRWCRVTEERRSAPTSRVAQGN